MGEQDVREWKPDKSGYDYRPLDDLVNCRGLYGENSTPKMVDEIGHRPRFAFSPPSSVEVTEENQG